VAAQRDDSHGFAFGIVSLRVRQVNCTPLRVVGGDASIGSLSRDAGVICAARDTDLGIHDLRLPVVFDAADAFSRGRAIHVPAEPAAIAALPRLEQRGLQLPWRWPCET
jgi:hypothetical protein